jgi:tetratricopeptide (TPR) repeat protein
MARELQKQSPENEDADILVSNSLFDLAIVSGDSQSLEYRLEALPICEKLLRAKPSDARRQRSAALIHKYIAGYWLSGDDPDRALPYLQRALALDDARLASDPGNQGAKLDLSFDYSQLGAYYDTKHDLHTAIEYQRKTLAIRRELAASDPKDVWKQARLAYALTGTADLLIEAHDYRAALANLDESRRISEGLGVSGRDSMEDYARTLEDIGEANRALGNEQSACEQFAKTRDIYRKLGYSSSGSEASILAAVDKELSTCVQR